MDPKDLNLVATGEATSADFRESDSRKCPIAGASQSWSSYKKDLDFWRIQCSLEKSTVAAHIVNRGFARNPKFMSFKPLLEPEELGKEDGYKYLVKTMDDMTKDADPLLKTMRYEEWARASRNPNESVADYLTRWTISYNRARSEGLFPISEAQAAYSLYLSFGFTEDQMRSLANAFILDDKLTVQMVRDAVEKFQIVPKAAAQLSKSKQKSHALAAMPESASDYDAWDSTYDAWDFWDQEHGWLSFSDWQFDEQTSETVPVFWSENWEDYVVESEFGFLSANQCRNCGGFGHWAKNCPKNKGSKNKGGKTFGGKGFGKAPKGKSYYLEDKQASETDSYSGEADAYFGKGKSKSWKPKGGKTWKPKGASKGKGAARSGFQPFRSFRSYYGQESEDPKPPETSPTKQDSEDAVLESWANYVVPEFSFMTVEIGSDPSANVSSENAPQASKEATTTKPADGSASEPAADVAGDESKKLAPSGSATEPGGSVDLGDEEDSPLLDAKVSHSETITKAPDKPEESPGVTEQSKGDGMYRLKPLTPDDVSILDTDSYTGSAYEEYRDTVEGAEEVARLHRDGTLESRCVLFACQILNEWALQSSDAEGFVCLDTFLKRYAFIPLRLLWLGSHMYLKEFVQPLQIRKMQDTWKIRALLNSSFSPPDGFVSLTPAPGKTEPAATASAPAPTATASAPERTEQRRLLHVHSCNWKTIDVDQILSDVEALGPPPELLLLTEVDIIRFDTPHAYRNRARHPDHHAAELEKLHHKLPGRWGSTNGDCCVLFRLLEKWDHMEDYTQEGAVVRYTQGSDSDLGAVCFNLVEQDTSKPVPMQFRMVYSCDSDAEFLTSFCSDKNSAVWIGAAKDGCHPKVTSVTECAGVSVALLREAWSVASVSTENRTTAIELTKNRAPKRKQTDQAGRPKSSAGPSSSAPDSKPTHNPPTAATASSSVPDSSPTPSPPAASSKPTRPPPPPPRPPSPPPPTDARPPPDPWGERFSASDSWDTPVERPRQDSWQGSRDWRSDDWCPRQDSWQGSRDWRTDDWSQNSWSYEKWGESRGSRGSRQSYMVTDTSADASYLSVPLEEGELILDPGCTSEMGSPQAWEILDGAMQKRYGFGFMKFASSATFGVANGGASSALQSYEAKFEIPNIGIFTLGGSSVDCGSNQNRQTPVLMSNQTCMDLKLKVDLDTGFAFSKALGVGIQMRKTVTKHWAIPIFDLLDIAGAVAIKPGDSVDVQDVGFYQSSALPKNEYARRGTSRATRTTLKLYAPVRPSKD